jgi:sodium-dependent dicarboxylate transporter 2/3/5
VRIPVLGTAERQGGRGIASKIGLAVGPLLFIFVAMSPIDDLSQEGRIVLGLALWMATWWVTAAIPIYATALLPIAVLPATGALQLVDVVVPYADRIIFLFMGGLLLAKAVEKSGAHKRFALGIVSLFGTRPKYIVAGFMVVTGVLSAWMSNTATAMVMIPIAAAVVALVPDEKQRSRFGVCLILAVAYSASLGGMATLVGTPPNAVFASLSKSLLDIDVSFVQWMAIGVPASALSLFVAWLYMVHIGARVDGIAIAGGRDLVRKMLASLGKMSSQEKAAVVLFGAAAVAWITRGLVWGHLAPGIDDSVIAIGAAMLAFIIPARAKEAEEKRKPLLDWEAASKIPWGVLILVGGGLSLAGAFSATGLDAWLAGNLSFLGGMHYLIVVLIIAGVTIFISEMISNTATVALIIPIAASLSGTLGIDPMLLMVPVAVATAYGFMMPVGTPPNAIAFASGYVTAPKMARVGIVLDVIGVMLVTAITAILVPLVWG